MRSFWIYLACSAALVSASAAYAALTGGGSPKPAIASAASTKQPRVKIAGYVEYLYPGGPARLQLTLRNRSRQRVTVRRVKASVRDAGPECSAAYLSVPPRKHLKLKIRPGKRRGVAMTATLSRSAGVTCQNATFPLKYSAKVKVKP
jgi:hypothetical protein